MFEESELITLLITMGVGFFLLVMRKIIPTLPSYRFLVLSFGFYLIAKVCTVLEGFFWEGLLNTLEHLSTILFCAVFFGWCLKMGSQKEAER